MNKISGVYKIINTITGDFYIGSSSDIEDRWANHRSYSAWNYLPNSKLYQAMSQYGRDNFTFEIVEETSNLKEREQYWINEFHPSYNSRRANELDIERRKKADKEYYSRTCLYNGETITLRALSLRFYRRGIPHATQEAKKYIIK